MTFYQFMMKFVDPEANDPISRLANQMHEDIDFPKQSHDFHEISDYIEGSLAYTRLVAIFDQAWLNYQNHI